MSGRPSRTRRRSASAPAEDEQEGEEQELLRAQNGRRKKRRSEEQNPESVDNEGLDAEAGGAAAAAAAAVPRQPLPQVPVSGQDVAKMDEMIQKYKGEAQEAYDKADDLGISRQTLNLLVAKVVRFMLFRNYEKPDVPVKRDELRDLIQKDQKGGRGATKLPGLVLPLAAAKLAEALGLEMLTLERPAGGQQAARAAAGEGGGTATQTYVLRSLLPPVLVQRFVQDSADDAMRGLMTTVVALLELAPGKQMEAEELWRHLPQLGVEQEPGEDDRYEQACVFGRDRAAGVLGHMERARLVVKKHGTQQAAADGGPQVLYELGEAANEPQFKAGVKALLDSWLGADGAAADGQQ